MSAILEQRIVKLASFFAEILGPFFAFGITIDVACVVFTFDDKNAFFRDYDEINFGGFAVFSGDVDIAKNLVFRNMKFFGESKKNDLFARIACVTPFVWVT